MMGCTYRVEEGMANHDPWPRWPNHTIALVNIHTIALVNIHIIAVNIQIIAPNIQCTYRVEEGVADHDPHEAERAHPVHAGEVHAHDFGRRHQLRPAALQAHRARRRHRPLGGAV